MLHTAALPFILHRTHDVISGGEITSTREELHGLLHLDGEQLVIQWRTTRVVSRVGREIRTDRELVPIREIAIPLAGLAEVYTRRIWNWKRWRFIDLLVLTASDMRTFDSLTGDDSIPGLVLEHPAEITLELRRADQMLVRKFVSELQLAISEQALAELEKASPEQLPGAYSPQQKPQ